MSLLPLLQPAQTLYMGLMDLERPDVLDLTEDLDLPSSSVTSGSGLAWGTSAGKSPLGDGG